MYDISPQPQQHGIYTRFKQKRKIYCMNSGATCKSKDATALKKVLLRSCSPWSILEASAALLRTEQAEVLI